MKDKELISPKLPLGFPCGKESACNEGDLGSIPELGRSPGEGKGYPLQYSGLENSTDHIAHGVAKKLDMTEQLSLSLYFPLTLSVPKLSLSAFSPRN